MLVRIKLCPASHMSEFYFNKDKPRLARTISDMYLLLPPVILRAGTDTFEAAEEAFDLTNNPARQDERMERYGNGRSISIGDIVEAGGNEFLCDNNGWVKL